MSVSKESTGVSLKIDYKPAYDTSGNLDYPSWSQTFSAIKETATLQQQRDFVVALASLTEYYDAPYRVLQVETSELVVN